MMMTKYGIDEFISLEFRSNQFECRQLFFVDKSVCPQRIVAERPWRHRIQTDKPERTDLFDERKKRRTGKPADILKSFCKSLNKHLFVADIIHSSNMLRETKNIDSSVRPSENIVIAGNYRQSFCIKQSKFGKNFPRKIIIILVAVLTISPLITISSIPYRQSNAGAFSRI